MAETLSLQAAREISQLLPVVQNNMIRRFNAGSDPALTPLQLEALHLIADSGPLAMNVIAARMHMSKQQLTRFIDGLVRRDYLQRKSLQNNRRTIYIDITEEGHQAVALYHAEALAFHVRELSGFSEAELEQIRDSAKVLRVLLARIQA